MSQHQSQEDDSPPIPLRRELDLETAELIRNALTSLGGYTVHITNEVRTSTRIMRENNARLTMIQYFTIALLLFVIAFDLHKFMAIP
ncbi:hypothetical protein SLEP1_g27434 [Rubroshorea leprosula]|uniref:Uncharacterized protein n=1 Tax=Rubroshorea leprosula TaxID=152421 RepID=A0AAV5K1R7_9ROSI|nr:hypothetical protein SLEP1_g27434 [Rubroshorea leprosula]